MEATPQPMEVKFVILPNGSQRSKPLLVSNDGFSYTVNRVGAAVTSWRCSVRKCGGIVKQKVGGFIRTRTHCHAAQPGLHLGAQMKEKVCTLLILYCYL